MQNTEQIRKGCWQFQCDSTYIKSLVLNFVTKNIHSYGHNTLYMPTLGKFKDEKEKSYDLEQKKDLPKKDT